MLNFGKGRFIARQAQGAKDIARALDLRARCFRSATDRDGPRETDRDSFDDSCVHILVENSQNGALVCCFRLMPFLNGGEISKSYSARHYGLTGLRSFGGPMVEMGRFCIDPACSDPDVLRVAWGALTCWVEANGVEMLFGCSSFDGTEAHEFYDAFALLRDRHIAPKQFLPRVKAPDVFRFSQRLRRKPDAKRAQKAMPPLLRSYLMMGGWVSDHAVIDRDLGTLHVFTGLEIGAIPAARARLMRRSAS